MIIPAGNPTISPFSSFIDLLSQWARVQANDKAFVFLNGRGTVEQILTYQELANRSHSLALHLRQCASAGERAVLVFAPGIGFVVAFFACLTAGLIAVPMMVPRRQSARDSSRAIVYDCAPRLALSDRVTLTGRPDLVDRIASWSVELIEIDSIATLPTSEVGSFATLRQCDVAFLQYTSGSTSDPKGVMVTHDNMLANSEMIRVSHSNTARSTFVSWLPHYHDMGLMLNILQSVYLGAMCVLMSPTTFLQRPFLWLQAIHSFRAEVAGAPNFAFDLCVDRFLPDAMEGLDLSCWKVAINGAEPVRARTLERFAAKFANFGFDRRAIFPAYGLAEATVLVTAGRRGCGPTLKTSCRNDVVLTGDDVASRTLVGCGKALPGESLAIVDPATRRAVAADVVGEIWVHGPNVTRGYWGKEGESSDTCHALIEGDPAQPWLRTGDLGLVDDSGELFVVGRIKDIIIVRGVNHQPHDIETTVQDSHPALRRGHGAAFGFLGENGEEQLVIVQEVERTARHRISPADLRAIIQESVVEQHGIAPYRIVLVQPAQIPRTTSGKIQRSLTRTKWRAGHLREMTEPV